MVTALVWSNTPLRNSTDLEVLDKLPRLDADGPDIDALATHAEQHEAVERLEDLDAGLVDGHHHRAPVACHVAHRRHDCCSGARVQARRRLVQELHEMAQLNQSLRSTLLQVLTSERIWELHELQP